MTQKQRLKYSILIALAVLATMFGLSYLQNIGAIVAPGCEGCIFTWFPDSPAFTKTFVEKIGDAGGFITTLADSAFAFACNSRNQMTVASGLSIDFLAPARKGDRLIAEATEVSLAGRTGVYDVNVRNQDNVPVAVLRGRSYAMKGRMTVPPNAAAGH